MKILYLGVHFYKNESNWRSETWINNSFNNCGVQTERIDYRQLIKEKKHSQLKEEIEKKSKKCSLIFLQRAENLSPELFESIKIPIIFWSTEPINLKNDVDNLLSSNIFKWVYLHSYSCLRRVENEFSHLIDKCSVLHNALPKEKINFEQKKKKHFAIFNRNRSLRRRWWILYASKFITVIKGNYGDSYYNDLSEATISINIHYSKKNIDDFETGIFEALARGCVVVSESLNNQVVKDLNLKDVIIQVKNPKELKSTLRYLKNNQDVIKKHQLKSKESVIKNTWDYRINEIKNKMEEILLQCPSD